MEGDTLDERLEWARGNMLSLYLAALNVFEDYGRYIQTGNVSVDNCCLPAVEMLSGQHIAACGVRHSFADFHSLLVDICDVWQGFLSVKFERGIYDG